MDYVVIAVAGLLPIFLRLLENKVCSTQFSNNIRIKYLSYLLVGFTVFIGLRSGYLELLLNKFGYSISYDIGYLPLLGFAIYCVSLILLYVAEKNYDLNAASHSRIRKVDNANSLIWAIGLSRIAGKSPDQIPKKTAGLITDDLEYDILDSKTIEAETALTNLYDIDIDDTGSILDFMV